MQDGAASVLHRVFSNQTDYQVECTHWIAHVYCNVSAQACMAVQQQALRFTPVWAQKLVNSAKLSGHEGCVNRLAWNEDGSLLASGSDDRQVNLPL